jgi:hypothetical protein
VPRRSVLIRPGLTGGYVPRNLVGSRWDGYMYPCGFIFREHGIVVISEALEALHFKFLVVGMSVRNLCLALVAVALPGVAVARVLPPPSDVTSSQADSLLQGAAQQSAPIN